jgi:hypothetical protein
VSFAILIVRIVVAHQLLAQIASTKNILIPIAIVSVNQSTILEMAIALIELRAKS